MIAARSVPVAGVAAVYLGTTVVAAMRTEEATLDERFAGEYAAYREGRAVPSDRPFSLGRVFSNREPRTLLGLAIAWGDPVLEMLGDDLSARLRASDIAKGMGSPPSLDVASATASEDNLRPRSLTRLANRSRERSERWAKVGGADGTRTRDLWRDRPAF